jgi:hypothetical protein
MNIHTVNKLGFININKFLLIMKIYKLSTFLLLLNNKQFINIFVCIHETHNRL